MPPFSHPQSLRIQINIRLANRDLFSSKQTEPQDTNENRLQFPSSFCSPTGAVS
jgi:hypothetical protein